jgi:predicted small integral membrane protein
MRYLKMTLIFFVALQGLVGGMGNLASFNTGTYDAVASVLSMEGVPEAMPRVFAFDAPVFIWLGACWILVLKLVTGITGAYGAWRLFRARNDAAEAFHAAKYWGLVACGASIVMLFGGFIVIGTTMLFMWQTPMGLLAFEAATYLLACLGVIALFVNMRND